MTESLAEYALLATEPAIGHDRTRFVVEDDRAAEWAAAKLRQARRRLDDVTAQADDQRRLIDAWLEDVSGPLTSDVDYFAGLLTDYLRRRHDDDPDCKSIKLPSATVKSRAGRDTVNVVHADKFEAWAEGAAPDLLRTTTSPDKRALASLPTTDEGYLVHPDTGEVVPGVGITPGTRTFSVEVRQ